MVDDSVLLIYPNTKGPSQVKRYATTQKLALVPSTHTVHTQANTQKVNLAQTSYLEMF